MSAQRRDFFVARRVVFDMSEMEAWLAKLPAIEDELGEDLVAGLVGDLRTNPRFVERFFSEMRVAWWWIRNDRWTDHTQLLWSVGILWDCSRLLELSGICSLDELHAITDCLSHGCVCSGCDLENGQRFLARAVSLAEGVSRNSS